MVLRHGRNATLQTLQDEFPALRGGANGAVGQLFLDMSLYILGSDSRVDDMVTSFFSRLFPLAYRRLLGGVGSAGSEECLRGSWRDTGAFGPYPKMMMTRLSRSLLATRVFLQALNLGIEVVNTTNHLRAGRDCGRALLRLWHCPRCQGLLEAPPCHGFCLAVMRGCLGGASEVQPHWRGYVEGLGTLVGAMRGEQDLEAMVMRLHALVRLALRHALNIRSRLKAALSKTCSYSPSRVSRSATVHLNNAHPALKSVTFHMEETLAGRRREFIATLRSFSTFYSSLGEALCSRKSTVLNDSLCWNGQEMTDRFVGTGLKRALSHSPESKHKAPEPVISQIIDKLKHINQLLRMVTAPERRWRARAGGRAVDRGGTEEGDDLESGDCDDEDECGGASGLGPPPRLKRLRIFADVAGSLALDDLTFNEQLLTPRLASDSEGGESPTGATRGLRGPTALPGATFLFTLIITMLGSH
ncbi:hypothetical protein GJAV_G00136270 [Gymnothorax javanicus]|nr:hypothetical protein GJAV_G00136270 [Gymnothorax javanicus]